MTSRIKNFIDQDRNTRDDMSFIVDDNPTQVDVYRIPTTGTGVGFANEVGNYTLIKKLVCRLDLQQGTGYSRVSSDGIKGTAYDYVAITFDTDVQMNDKWYFNGEYYLVSAINESKKGYIEVLLKQLRNEP
jgi:hypothetical protein